MVPVRDPVIVPVREPVIVPTRELREPGIVPPNEALAIDKVRSVANEIFRNIIFLLASGLLLVARGENRILPRIIFMPAIK
jgi:hypothetical protein